MHQNGELFYSAQDNGANVSSGGLSPELPGESESEKQQRGLNLKRWFCRRQLPQSRVTSIFCFVLVERPLVAEITYCFVRLQFDYNISSSVHCAINYFAHQRSFHIRDKQHQICY